MVCRSQFMLKDFAYLLLLLVLVSVYCFLWLCLAEVPFFMCLPRLIFQCFCDAKGGEWFGVLMHSTPFLFNLLQNIQQGRLWTLWSTLIASIAGLIFEIVNNFKQFCMILLWLCFLLLFREGSMS